MAQTQQLDPGTAVYDAQGVWVGIVSLRNTPGASLVIQKGRWFPKDIRLPAHAIERADDEAVYLRLSAVELKSGRYSSPPAQEDAAPRTRGADDQAAAASRGNPMAAPATPHGYRDRAAGAT